MHVKNHNHHANYHNLNYLFFSLKLIPFKFYIWKIKKVKSLSLVSKKGYLDCEYAQEFYLKIQNHFNKPTIEHKPPYTKQFIYSSFCDQIEICFWH
jgi:hypothetical protein